MRLRFLSAGECDHPFRRAEYDARVVAVCGDDIHLAVHLAVCIQVIYGKCCGKLGLSVFLGNLKVQVLVPPDVIPRSVRFLTLRADHLTVELAHHIPLPVHQTKRCTG